MQRVLLIVDVVFYRDCLERLLLSCHDLTLAGAVSNRDAEAAVTGRDSPDLVLLDANAPEARTTLAMLRKLPNAPVVIAVAMEDVAERIVEWIEAGAAGYVPRTASFEEMLKIVHATSRGETHCSPRVMHAALHRLASLAETSKRQVDDRGHEFTGREREIIQLLAQGQSNKVIARRLGISYATAKNYVHQILHKMKLHRRAQVAAYLTAPRE